MKSHVRRTGLEVTSNTAAVQRFDPNADRWTQLPAAPGKVSDAAAAVVGGRLIVAGGESIGTVFSTVWAYDLVSSTWSTLPNLPAPRHGLAVAGDRQHPLRHRRRIPARTQRVHPHRANPHLSQLGRYPVRSS